MKSLHDQFNKLVDLPIREQAAALCQMDLAESEIAELRAMLDADRQGIDPLAEPLFFSADKSTQDGGAAERLINTEAGPFRIAELLGEGGSSFVFRAERAAGSGTQTVALKMMRAGVISASAARRFRREHGILAQLNHPDIARLIEGGVSANGAPYIAMELVNGEPITVAANQLQLDLDARLNLFVRLCRAVDAAHAALIVHRDLKPSNILVTKHGDLKVLDFGIAKLLAYDSDTLHTKTISLTPDYAAPEQFRGEHPTVAIDIFALGVLLRELLTGRRNHDESLAVTVYRSASPPLGLGGQPELARRLRGDLDAIVATATHFDATKRYRSADALAADIDNYRAGRPVSIRAANRLYRVHKFLRRHRTGAASSVLLLLVVATSLGLAIWQAMAAHRAASRAAAVRDLVVEMLEGAKASLPHDLQPTPDTLVEQAALKLAAARDLDSDTRAELETTLGEVWLSLSKFAVAENFFKMALDHARAIDDQPAELKLVVLLAQSWQGAGRNTEAVEALEPLLDNLQRAPAGVLIRALSVLGDAELGLDRREQALEHKREAAKRSATFHGVDHIEAMAAQLSVAAVLTEMSRFSDAADLLEPALQKWRTLQFPHDNRYVEALADLGVARDWLGFHAEAEARAREILEAKRRIYPAPHVAIARSLRDLAVIVDRRGAHTEAETLLKDALSMDVQIVGGAHVETLSTLSSLGITYSVQRRYAEAEKTFRTVLRTCAEQHLRDDVCMGARNSLGISYHREERLPEAIYELRGALEERKARYGAGHFTVAVSMTRLANALADAGFSDESLELAEGSLRILVRQKSLNGRESAYADMVAAKALESAGQHERALKRVEAILSNPGLQALESDRRVNLLILKAKMLRSLGRMEAMRETVRTAQSMQTPLADLWPASERLLTELQSQRSH